MKLIIAIIKPFLAEKAILALEALELSALSINEVKGLGRQKNYLSEYQENEYSRAYLPKVELLVWAEDHQVDDVVRTLVDATRTGRMGDGKIFVLPVSSEYSMAAADPGVTTSLA